MAGPLGNSKFCFPRISLFVSGNIEILGKQNSLFPRDQSLSVKYLNSAMDGMGWDGSPSQGYPQY